MTALACHPVPAGRAPQPSQGGRSAGLLRISARACGSRSEAGAAPDTGQQGPQRAVRRSSGHNQRHRAVDVTRPTPSGTSAAGDPRRMAASSAGGRRVLCAGQDLHNGWPVDAERVLVWGRRDEAAASARALVLVIARLAQAPGRGTRWGQTPGGSRKAVATLLFLGNCSVASQNSACSFPDATLPCEWLIRPKAYTSTELKPPTWRALARPRRVQR